MASEDNTKDKRDTLFAIEDPVVEKFTFDENVADVFDDMIHRSVPGYDAIVAMIGLLAERYARDGTCCYDLGCSLGEVTFNILKNINDRSVRIVAVDSSAAMIDKLTERLQENNLQSRVEVSQADIRNVEIDNASMVVLNFVLQFLEPQQRTPLLERIFDGMLPGSILILSEKITFDNRLENEFQINVHHDFKKLQGYSDLEISQKRAALEEVLVPDTFQIHMQRLKDCGFRETYLWFQCFNFISIVAIK